MSKKFPGMPSLFKSSSKSTEKIDSEWKWAGERNSLDKDRFNLISCLVLQKNKKYIDVGACRGEYIAMAQNFIPSESIYAFEPIPFMYHHLVSTFPNVNIYNVAVSSQIGHGDFFVANNEELSGLVEKNSKFLPTGTVFEKIAVSIVTLDEVIDNKNDVGLIKIDVEGNELAVLKGAESLISQSRPAIYCEWGTNGPENYNIAPESLFAWCGEHEYEILTIDGQAIGNRDLFLDSFYNWPIWNYLLIPRR